MSRMATTRPVWTTPAGPMVATTHLRHDGTPAGTWRRQRRGMTSRLLPCLAVALLLTAACSGPSTPAPAPPPAAPPASPGPGPSAVLFLGDSIAVGEALPLSAAFAASKVPFRS